MENTTDNSSYGGIAEETVVFDGVEMDLTMEEARYLAQFSYLDFNDDYDPTGETLRKVLNDVLQKKMELPLENGGYAWEDYVRLINDILDGNRETGKYDTLLDLEYIGYFNENVRENKPYGTGVVLAVLTDGSSIIILVTGSEGGADASTAETIPYLTADWISNYLLGAGAGHPEVKDQIEQFCSQYLDSDQPILFLGHSRAYALQLIGAAYLYLNGKLDVNVVGFSGFSGYYSLTEEEQAALAAIFPVNYVVEGDFVPYIGPPVGGMFIYRQGEYMIKWNPELEQYLYYHQSGEWVLDENGNRVDVPGIKAGFAHYLGAIFHENGYYQLDDQSFMPRFVRNLTTRMIARNPPYLDKLLKHLAEIETPLMKREREQQEAADGRKYVVKGAVLSCSRGLRNGKLLMAKSNGVWIHDLPQAAASDNKKENIVSFAGCCSLKNPSTQEAHAKMLEKMSERERDNLDKKIREQGLKERFMKGSFDPDVSAAYGVCMFDTVMPWIETKETVFLNGEEALLKRSKLVCLYGGVISIENEGQLE